MSQKPNDDILIGFSAGYPEFANAEPHFVRSEIEVGPHEQDGKCGIRLRRVIDGRAFGVFIPYGFPRRLVVEGIKWLSRVKPGLTVR